LIFRACQDAFQIKIKEKEITIMKKFIKNYLAKLQENDKKGFSLVELIIVMAIMAILVGVVASQVIPYMEKSRQSKDQQQISSLCTSLVSAIAQDGDYDLASEAAKETGGKKEFALSALATNTSDTIASTFADLCGATDVAGVVSGTKAKFVSKVGKAEAEAGKTGNDFWVTLTEDGSVTIDYGTAAGSPASAKMTAKSE
jgi:prepilin-type N-terminal cleavage/methylation domain-containing protein